MRKFGVALLAVLSLAMVGCGKTDKKETTAAKTEAQTEVKTTEEKTTEAKTEEKTTEAKTEAETESESEADTEAESESEAEIGVMSYDEYMAAELDSKVVVETYVQAKQSWWEDKATVYTQDKDGAYFLYNMACSEEDYEKLTPGTKIQVTGYKSEWSGEIEITDATFTFVEGADEFVAEPKDVTELLGKDELIDSQNQLVSFKGLTVEAAGQDADGKDVAFLYNWDGSGEDGNDLYFNVSVDGTTYTFTVESYLCDNTTDVYKAVKELKIGDVIDAEGFLYWYEGVNPHITSVTVVK